MKASSPIMVSPPRRASGLVRYIVVAAVIVTVFFYLRPSYIPQQGPHFPGQFDSNLEAPLPPSSNTNDKAPASPPPPPPAVASPSSTTTPKSTPEPEPKKQSKPVAAVPAPTRHPIDELIEKGERSFVDLLKKETDSLKATAEEYRKRRGRHPPPGFDKWYNFAKEKNIVMVEDFFDQIYDDLRPYWAVNPALIRKEARTYEMTINVRNHNATAGSDWFWTQIWLKLLKTMEEHLPDMDLALNAMDEPRVVAPWEEINELVQKEQQSRQVIPASEVISEFQTLPPRDKGDEDVEVKKKDWEREGSYWEMAIRGCPPDSPARKAAIVRNFNSTPVISLHYTLPHSYKGYISNFTKSTDFCNQPDLQALEGIFISPLSIANTKQLFPLFGGSKLPTNNEILLPAPMYLDVKNERFSGGEDHGGPWKDKTDGIVWRGVATGGRNKPDNWRGFQRHRFIAMTNATKLSAAESWQTMPENWALPSSSYDLAAQQDGRLGEWAKSWSDTGFIDLMCPKGGDCNHTKPYFKLSDSKAMSEQYAKKFLPDIDGNSFSGRYRGFLLSTSVPIKSTIFREWHDSRLVPWVHFIPMDNRFGDFFGIMEYFLGYDGGESGRKRKNHDEQAAKIASAGKEWAEKVLRIEDMQVYVLRLLLEYARVSDERRDKMGWVGDLV
ncbi:glycosyltransferase family 90 protein [Xylogone sp. PMI_703]|nr:glycosyltransferase family 90 protein [Xylogone sp. PMI_703]